MTRPEAVGELVERLTEVQRALLLRYAPTLDEQPISEVECFHTDCELFVELRPQAHEDGCLIDPGEKVWFASMSAHSPAGSSEWDECTIRYNETGLALRAALERPHSKEQGK